MSLLNNLRSLSLCDNLLTSFPLVLCRLKVLDVLDLSRNKIREIPDGVECLQVSELNLNQNQVSTISESVASCPRLKVLRVEENCLQLSSIPAKLLIESQVSLLAIDGNLFELRDFHDAEGYEQYMERYTATKKKIMWMNDISVEQILPPEGRRISLTLMIPCYRCVQFECIVTCFNPALLAFGFRVNPTFNRLYENYWTLVIQWYCLINLLPNSFSSVIKRVSQYKYKTTTSRTDVMNLTKN